MYTYTRDKAGRPRLQLDGKRVSVKTLPASRKFDTPVGPCVVVAKNLDEQVALANAEKPEDIEGYTEAVQLIRG